MNLRMSFVKVLSVAKMGVLELFHRKVFWALAVVGAALILLSVFLASLSINEQFRVLSQVGSFGLQACGLIFAMTLGGRLVSQEIERQSFQLDLSRPLSRGEWLLGKWLAGAGLLIGYSVALHFVFRLALQSVLAAQFHEDRFFLMMLLHRY
jgi:ABC-type transport system involved in multi-copper enzyme maturation permease subunit